MAKKKDTNEREMKLSVTLEYDRDEPQGETMEQEQEFDKFTSEERLEVEMAVEHILGYYNPAEVISALKLSEKVQRFIRNGFDAHVELDYATTVKPSKPQKKKNLKLKKGQRPVEYHGHKLLLIEGTYHAGGRLALVLVEDDPLHEPYAWLTVNLPDEHLEEGEFFVKTWSENAEIAKHMLETGWFEDTGKRVPTGFTEAHVWRFKNNG